MRRAAQGSARQAQRRARDPRDPGVRRIQNPTLACICRCTGPNAVSREERSVLGILGPHRACQLGAGTTALREAPIRELSSCRWFSDLSALTGNHECVWSIRLQQARRPTTIDQRRRRTARRARARAANRRKVVTAGPRAPTSHRPRRARASASASALPYAWWQAPTACTARGRSSVCTVYAVYAVYAACAGAADDAGRPPGSRGRGTLASHWLGFPL